jgi:hypothetical protein
MQQSFYDNSGKKEKVIPTSVPFSVPWMLFCGTGSIVITPEYIFCSSELLSPDFYFWSTDVLHLFVF